MHRRSATRIAAIALGIALVPGVAAAIPVKMPMLCLPAGSGSVTISVPTKIGKPYEMKGSFKGLPANLPFNLQFACNETADNIVGNPGTDGAGKLKFKVPLGYASMATCTNPRAVVVVGGTTCKTGWVLP